ncbi:MAG: hydrogenase maturation protease [Alphaproteobacteria bacterium]|nr:hydrogenase maturation protease [Alphaproteobacteria bacterium]
MSSDTLIIGIGNRFRGDDALGCLMAERIKAQVSPDDAEVIEHDGEPASLIDLWQAHKAVILIDAVSSGARAGTIHHIDLREQALPDRFRSYSTHAFGIAEAVELARVLGKLPERIVFYGVEGKSFSADTELSAPLKTASEVLYSRILQNIRKEREDA